MFFSLADPFLTLLCPRPLRGNIKKIYESNRQISYLIKMLKTGKTFCTPYLQGSPELVLRIFFGKIIHNKFNLNVVKNLIPLHMSDISYFSIS